MSHTHIYFDNWLCTPVAPAICGSRQISVEFPACPQTQHRAGRETSAQLFEARLSLSALFETKPENVVFAAGETEALAICVYHAIKQGVTRIIISQAEATVARSVLYAFRKIARLRIEVLPADTNGFCSSERLNDCLQGNDLKMLYVSSPQWTTGAFLPLNKTVSLCRQHNTLLCVNLANFVACYAFNLAQSGIFAGIIASDRLHCASAGAIVLLDESRAIHRANNHRLWAEFGIHTGTVSLLSAGEITRSLEYFGAHREELRNNLAALKRQMHTLISGQLPHWKLLAPDPDTGACNLISVQSPFRDTPETLQKRLDSYGIAAGTYNLTRIQSSVGEKSTAVNFSFSCLNTPAEVEACISVLSSIR